MKKNILNQNLSILYLMIILFVTYIFPSGLIDESNITTKAIFSIASFILILLNIKKFKWYDYFIFVTVLLFLLFTRKIGYLSFISIPLCMLFIEDRKKIFEYLKKSNILYVCLFFTLVYSVVFFGTDGRYAFSAIKEINQSGLAIFCLGMMLVKKNKKVGIFTLLFGLLTFSRSYILCLIIWLISKSKLYQKHIKKINIKRFNYIFFVIATTIIFVALAYYYMYKFKNGDIGMNGKFYKFINVFDYSNLFRFTAILYVVMMMLKNPKYILLGLDERNYNSLCQSYANHFNVPFRPTDPHNLFFSHLKIYGFLSIIETIYLSHILKKVTTHDNYYIFISLVFYSLILGAGFYSYWLFMSLLVLMQYQKEEKSYD